MHLSREAARTLMVAAQGLHERPTAPAGKEDVLAAIRRMGALQIDSISIVARSPYLVLWSRLGPYDPRALDELLEEGRIFEYWAHAASFLPVEDFRLYRPRMLARGRDGSGWVSQHPEVVERVLSAVRESGPVRAAEFASPGKGPRSWWDRKPEKIALEALFDAGVLMIVRRENFHRVYDLRERVLTGWTDDGLPSEEQVRWELALRAVRCLGIAAARWVPDYFRLSKRGIAALLEEMASEDALIPVSLEGESDPAYVHPDHRDLALKAAAGELRPTRTALLSPFDPLVWDRARARELFGFDYRIEVYTPAEKRRYGYYTTPILHRGALVGRLDPKAHRKEGIFEVRAIHLEPGVGVTGELAESLREMLRECAEWHGTPQVVVRRSDPPELAPMLAPSLPEEGKRERVSE